MYVSEKVESTFTESQESTPVMTTLYSLSADDKKGTYIL